MTAQSLGAPAKDSAPNALWLGNLCVKGCLTSEHQSLRRDARQGGQGDQRGQGEEEVPVLAALRGIHRVAESCDARGPRHACVLSSTQYR